MAQGAPYKCYKYIFEYKFLASRIEQTTNRDEVMLRVWEPPEPGGVYVLGIDPSGGGGDDANDHAIQVFKGYADRLIQVAEFQSNRPLTYQLAWCLCHLCGAYKDHIANLEITGIGAAVMPEVANLRQLAMKGILQARPETDNILDMIGNVRWFLYKRVDTMGGAGNVLNFKANQDSKHMIYSEMRDSLMLRRVEIRSTQLIQQIQAVVEDEGWIGAGPDTGVNDDLVSAAVLAHHTWVEWRRAGLIARGLTWDSVKGDRPPQTMSDMASHAFERFFVNLNRRQRQHVERF